MNSRTREQYIQSLADRFVMHGEKASGWKTATNDERADAKVLVDRLFASVQCVQTVKQVKGAAA